MNRVAKTLRRLPRWKSFQSGASADEPDVKCLGNQTVLLHRGATNPSDTVTLSLFIGWKRLHNREPFLGHYTEAFNKAGASIVDGYTVVSGLCRNLGKTRSPGRSCICGMLLMPGLCLWFLYYTGKSENRTSKGLEGGFHLLYWCISQPVQSVI